MLQLPKLSAFPPARDHFRVDELRVANDSFFLDTWPFESQSDRDFFVSCDPASWITKTIPDGEFEKMIWACRAFSLLLFADDWIERQPLDKGRNVRNDMARIVRGEKAPRAGSVVEELMDQVHRGIEANTGAAQYRQFSDLTCECLRLQDPQAHKDFREYLDFRHYNIGGYWSLAVARYALDIYLTDEELHNPLLVKCERLALDAVVMENDVSSYEKEVIHGTLGNNAVAMLLQHGIDGRTFGSASAAKVYIQQRIADVEVQVHQGISVALEHSVLEIPEATRKWLMALPYIISGNTWWSQQSPRYNSGNPVPRRVIHLEGEGDILVTAVHAAIN